MISSKRAKSIAQDVHDEEELSENKMRENKMKLTRRQLRRMIMETITESYLESVEAPEVDELEDPEAFYAHDDASDRRRAWEKWATMSKMNPRRWFMDEPEYDIARDRDTSVSHEEYGSPIQRRRSRAQEIERGIRSGEESARRERESSDTRDSVARDQANRAEHAKQRRRQRAKQDYEAQKSLEDQIFDRFGT